MRQQQALEGERDAKCPSSLAARRPRAAYKRATGQVHRSPRPEHISCIDLSPIGKGVSMVITPFLHHA
jgi:hypothetical protein